ncbi:MAG: CAP domain-containing protein, partial [Meiothermus sp.]|nr:CAP domain-containing protein [Meiothermus sp.]
MKAWLLLLSLVCSGVLAQSALELEVLQRTNQVRTERGLRPLQWDALAYKAALGHAQDMLRRNFFAHQNPDGLGAAERMRASGVLEVTNGENLASFEGYPDAEIPQRSLTGWMNSPGHRANLLKPEFTHLGVALVREGRRVMVVQNFIGRPFDPQLRQAPAQAERRVLVLSGTAPGTVGVFVGNHLYARL